MSELTPLSNNENIHIFGSNWVEVEGVAYIYNNIETNSVVYTYHSVFDIFDFLFHHADGRCILVVQPHKHAYFLYTLSKNFAMANIKIVANDLFLSDSIILSTLGFADVTTFDSFIHCMDEVLSLVTISKFHHLPSWNESIFLTFINNKILHGLNEFGVTEKQICVLSLILKGASNSKIGHRLKISSKTVSSHKREALKKLPHGHHPLAITKGLQALSSNN
ncbi:LuxR C-terminal-related transcriptional regulator [Hafnia paralvei]|uniref:LuxR C-terminal-related transcriptional regulator n=1 Tax=Hafnia paralvei TaxID=546367 RepID=UPI0010353599|nr:LuxR C-terminal-related transcriptional regulator [Hafnia paralvei]TBL65503.1 hypothetical protein EYY97_00255 [Hafnia paralvei]